MCKDCGLNTASFGLELPVAQPTRVPGRRKADRIEWCTGCAKASHPEAVMLGYKVCEVCKVHSLPTGRWWWAILLLLPSRISFWQECALRSAA